MDESAALAATKPPAAIARYPARTTAVPRQRMIRLPEPSMEHNLFGKPVPPFPDHALTAERHHSRRRGRQRDRLCRNVRYLWGPLPQWFTSLSPRSTGREGTSPLQACSAAAALAEASWCA